MWGLRRITRGTAATMLVVALQLAVCLVVLVAPLDGTPHGAPVTVTGPPIVADALVAHGDQRAGAPLDGTVVATESQARAEVESGRSVAALVIDVRLNSATLLVSSAQGPALTEAVTREVRAMAQPYAAAITVRDIAAPPGGSWGQTGLRLVVACAIALGLGIAIAVTWRRGPVADTWRESARRLVLAVGTAAVASGLLAVVAADRIGGEVLGWWAVACLAVLATGTATLALEGLFGVAGIGVATLVTVVSGTPLARVEHPLLLPEPWRVVTPWLPHGAALDAGRQIAFFDGVGTTRPVLVLASWVVVSYVLLAVARRERRRAGVTFSPGEGRVPATASMSGTPPRPAPPTRSRRSRRAP